MKKTMGKRIISGVTSILLGLSAFTQAIPLSDGGLLKAKAATVSEEDGLPILDMTYEESMWYRGNPLGVAGEFHYFAFDTADIGEHTNGNFAAKHVVGGQGYPNQYVGRLVNVIGESWTTSEAKLGKIADFVIPEDYSVLAENGSKLSYPTLKNSFEVTREDGTKFKVNNDNRPSELKYSYISHNTQKFMDFDALREEYRKLSDDFAAKPNNVEEFSIEDGNIKVKLHSSGENVINIKHSDLIGLDGNFDRSFEVSGINIEPGKELNSGVIKDGQFLIVNLDMEGYTEDTASLMKYFGTGLKCKTIDGKDLNGGGEKVFINGTNIILNIANAPELSASGDPKLTVDMGVGSIQILAPDVHLRLHGTNGNAIAEDVSNFGETHMSFFMQPLTEGTLGEITAKKSWSDGEDVHTNDSVKVTLYRSVKSDVELAQFDSLVAKDEARYNQEMLEYEDAYTKKLISAYKELSFWNNAEVKNYNMVMYPTPGTPILSVYGLDAGDANKSGEIDVNKRVLENSGFIQMNFTPPYSYNNIEAVYPYSDYTIGLPQMKRGTYYPEYEYVDLFSIERNEDGEEIGIIFNQPKYELANTYDNTIWIGYPGTDDKGNPDYSNGAKITIDPETRRVTKIDGEPMNAVIGRQYEKIGTTVLNSENEWEYKWTDLEKMNESGSAYFYYIVEEPVEKYSASYSNNGIVCGMNKSITVTNSKPGEPVKPGPNPEPPKPEDKTLTINKVAMTDGKPEIEGAEITLSGKDKDENAIVITEAMISGEFAKDGADGDNELESGEYKIEANVLTWISSEEKAMQLKNIPDGTYTLTEVSAPEGYAKVESTWSFVIDNGVVSELTESNKIFGEGESYIKLDSEKENYIEIGNAAKPEDKTLTINKVAMTDGKPEIEGAEITLSGKDKDENAIV
ncbi:MAG: Cna B-type domain-containing protein, partial [Ruminococcus sp.]|nr:Cna B-type domain-containing protein [Ruminococcus sp.]